MHPFVRFFAIGFLVFCTACSEEQSAPIGIVPVAASVEEESGISEAGDFVLAVSWHPAFCETRPNKSECRSERDSDFGASNFVLHGLWPQPRSNVYCGVARNLVDVDKSGRWRDLPRLDLDNATLKVLQQQMPGTQSYLDRHEWIKHGTCYSPNAPQEYYSESLHLLQQLNGSAVQELFAARIGKTVTQEDVQQAFDDSFGKEAGRRIELVCKPDGIRQIITEVRINLNGKITSASDMSDLISAAPSRRNVCQAALVDPVGLQ